MEFLKNNLFYVILVAVVLLVSIPSFIFASKRQEEIASARTRADAAMKLLESQVKGLSRVTPELLAQAEDYRKQWQDQKARSEQFLKDSDKHLDMDFLVEPQNPGDVPDAALYKEAYGKAFDGMIGSLVKAGVLKAKDISFSSKANFGTGLPTPEQIRISQKQYWILKEIADILADPATGVKGIGDVALDFVPNSATASNGPDDSGRFWVYWLSMDLNMDFRTFPVLMQKLVENKNITFVPDGFKVSRAFDDTRPVYVLLADVTLFCQVWDYISTPFEQDNLKKFRAGGGKQPAAGRGAAPAGRAPRATGGGAAAREPAQAGGGGESEL